MTAKEYEQFREIFLHQTLQLSDEKRIEYTEGNHIDNVLWNFENSAKDVPHGTPMTILIVFLNKHLSSLKSYFRTGKEYSESIEGRIMDIINYLLLLVAMIRTNKKKQSESITINDFVDPELESDVPEDRIKYTNTENTFYQNEALLNKEAKGDDQC